MMRRVAWIFAALLGGALGARAQTIDITDITVLNDTPRDRLGEVVSFGVPFAKGELLEEAFPFLFVTDAQGQEVPSQYRILARWTPDPSLRWVLVTFPASVLADSSATYHLKGGYQLRQYSGRNVFVDLMVVRDLFRQDLLRGIVKDGFGVEYLAQSPQLSVVETGPLKTIVRADLYHRAAPGSGIGRDFLWSTAYFTFRQGFGELQPPVQLDWVLKNSYTERPLGDVKLGGFSVAIRHFGSPASQGHFPEGAGVSAGHAPRLDYLDASPRPHLFGWGGDASANATLGIQNAWKTYPKAASVDALWTRAELLPDGEYVLDDGAHLGAKLMLAFNTTPAQSARLLEDFHEPLLYRLDRTYLVRTKAWGDFGPVANVPAGSDVPVLGGATRLGWNELGELFHSTHATGSPRNRYSYLLPYLQTGLRHHFEWVEDFLHVSKNLRPYHWNTLEKRFDADDYPGDRLFDGDWDWRRPGEGYQARQSMPAHYAAYQADHGGPWNGWDQEHLSVDDLRDWYLVTGDPKALESIEEIAQGLRTYEMCRDSEGRVHSARVLGWGLRTLLEAYRLTGDEDYWQSATSMVQSVLSKNTQRFTLNEAGYFAGWEPLIYKGQLRSGLTNYDHFKPWMSAVGGVGLMLYLDQLGHRLERGIPPEVDPAHLTGLIRDTAVLINDIGFRRNQGFIYEVDLYDDAKRYSGGISGTAEWNVEFLALAAYLTSDFSLFQRGHLLMQIQMMQKDLRGNPWYQVALSVAGLDH
ncbi:MAG: hypothetical protein RL885_27485 [Planctomycetota bacterium]